MLQNDSAAACLQSRIIADPHMQAGGAVWLAANWPHTPAMCLSVQFKAAFAAARRKLGDQSPHSTAFPSAFDELHPHQRPLSLLGRVALLLCAAEHLPESELNSLLLSLFQRGDTPERCAILCTLPLLAHPAKYLAIAQLATRQYVREVFEALVVDNPYPATYFSEADFNQVILKALFMGVSLQRIPQLNARLNDNLTDMVADFIQERRNAGRTVPEDVQLIWRAA